MTAPLLYIEPPDVEPYRYGLFGAAQPFTPKDTNGDPTDHWIFGGVEWESLAAYEAQEYPTGYLYCGAAGGSKTLSSYLGTTKASAFTVYGGVDCSSIGRPQDEYEQRALAILDLAGQHAAEFALWTGNGSTHAPALNAATTVDITPGAGTPSLHRGVGLLEAYLANHYNGKGVLHATRDVAAQAAFESQIVREWTTTSEDDARDDWLTTQLSTRWVFSGGGDGTGPNAAAPATGTAWIYGTGQLVIARSVPVAPANFNAALDKTHNREFLVAEQSYLVGIDGPIVACKVTLN